MCADEGHVLQFGSTALMVSAQNGHACVAEALLKNGADVNAKNNVSGG